MSQQGSYSGGNPGMGGNSNNLYPPNLQQNMSLHPPDYDPRRLFPFGLSPIPEVPSELASEVSSIASSPTPSYEDSDTEIESVRSGRSRGHSIMYSGSCDSIKSNVTIQGKSSSESSTETDHDSTEEETEDENEGYVVEEIPSDPSASVSLLKTTGTDKPLSPVMPIVQQSNSPNSQTIQYNNSENLHQRTRMQVDSIETNVRNDALSCPEEREITTPVMTEKITGDMVSGAATASEIFRHLQATRGKQEVTTELAKILTVLKTTLQTQTAEKDETSSSDEENCHNETLLKSPMPTGKPPRPPQKKNKLISSISPMIQAKIKELEKSKSNHPKEEMNLLSKILVHLLCSCKTVAAAQELRGIIKQFKEVAKVAMEEGDDTLELLRSNSRASSRNSGVRRKVRSRTASGNSNISGNSETDSMNTLTPGDSKSSGTDDEAAADSNLNQIRFVSNICKENNVESSVSYTLTLPLNKETEVSVTHGKSPNDEDEEWEWEYEDELDASTPTKQGSSGSSRNLTPSEGKSDVSTGSTRKLLTEMEMGAYNSSTSHSDQGNSISTPITEEEDILDDDDENDYEKQKRRLSDEEEVGGHLFCHLEETFKVLSDTYKIITTGNSPECDSAQQENASNNATENVVEDIGEVDESFENILDGISTQCVQLETEIMRSSRQSTATPEGGSTPVPPTIINKSNTSSRPVSRSGSKMASRPGSRLKPKTPLPGDDEEDWGDEDEWEYYYEEGEENVCTSRPASRQKETSRPASRHSNKSRPQSRQNLQNENKSIIKIVSRPSSRQMDGEVTNPTSRPTSRIYRPGSKAESKPNSRPASRVKGEENLGDEVEEWGEEDDWEYEYYYEEEVDETGKVTTRPVSRVASRAASRATSRAASRAKSRQDEQYTNVPGMVSSGKDANRPSQEQTSVDIGFSSSSKQELQRVSSRQIQEQINDTESKPLISRPQSRTIEVHNRSNQITEQGDEEEDCGEEWEYEYYYEEEVDNAGNVTSRPVSRQRVASRQGGKSRAQSRQEISSRVCSRQDIQKEPSRNVNKIENNSVPIPITTLSESKKASRPNSRVSLKLNDPITEEKLDEEDDGEDWEYEWYYEEDVDEAGNVTSRPVSRVASRVASRQDGQVIRVLSRANSRQGKEILLDSKKASRPNSRSSSKLKNPNNEDNREDEDCGEDWEYEWYYEEEVDEAGNVTSRPVSRVASRVASRQDGQVPIVSSRTNSRQGDLDKRPKNKGEDNNNSVSSTKPQIDSKSNIIGASNGTSQKDSTRPNSRQSQIQSRPNSRNSSRPSSRSGSRCASRIKRNKSSLGNVEEEEEYEWYYEDNEDMELTRLSPTLTTACTTRATSPFPGEEKAAAEVNNSINTGFSNRRMSMINEEDESTPRPSTVVSKTPTNRNSVTPKIQSMKAEERSPSSKSQTGNKTPSIYNSGEVGYLNPMAGVSVALAAEYLGQDAQQLVASLPVDFIQENKVVLKERKKKKERSKDKEGELDQEYDENDDKKKRKKKKKKEKDGKFLPKVGVKELANRLENELFQDTECGNKMVITRDEARNVIRESKKKSKNQDIPENKTVNTGLSPTKEEKRKSVKEMVELMANKIPAHEDMAADDMEPPTNYSINAVPNSQSNYNIPSISVTANGSMPPPVPPLPQGYYSSPTPQYPPNQYQPYPVEVRPQYPQQYPQNPEAMYQQFPPQSPYQQYQQQYNAYQGFPGPQQYQQYPPQPYQQYPTQIQPYPPGYQPYPPQLPPQSQPIIYASDNPNQVQVVSGGQTTMVNMRPRTTGSRQKDHPFQSNKSPEQVQEDDSEAYGTGSTGSDQTENQIAGIDHDDPTGADVQQEEVEGKQPHKRRSRLFKLLQYEGEYTDSDTESRSEYSRISMKNVEDNHCKESDIDSVCSGLERTTKGIDRKHSFRSHKSSNKESDNESVTSSGVERKISPNSMQKTLTTRRFMQLNLKTDYEPSSSEMSTPNSPTASCPADDRKKRASSKPPARVWNYHADDFDSHAGVSDDSSYQSLQSLNSFDSIYDTNAGREVEEIMKRKVNRDNLYRYQTDSPGNYVTASPKSVEILRNSPKTHASSPKHTDTYNRASPKIEKELKELSNFPSSPGISLRHLHSHRSFYGGGK